MTKKSDGMPITIMAVDRVKHDASVAVNCVHKLWNVRRNTLKQYLMKSILKKGKINNGLLHNQQ